MIILADSLHPPEIIRKNLDEKHEQMEMIDRMLDEVLAASKNN